MADEEPRPVPTPTNIPLPQKLDVRGNLSANWRKFRRMWDNYEIATRISEADPKYRTAVLLTCIGADALDIFDGLPFTQPADKENIDIVLQKFETFCIGETNETFERYCFNRRDQESSESIDSYLTVLRTMAKTCNYGPLENSLIRDRIVVGIRDNATRKRLLQDPRLTLTSCVDTCRAYESAAHQIKSITSKDEVHAVRDWSRRTPDKQPSKQRPSYKQKYCKYCGRQHEFVKEKCPAWGKTCTKCNNRNHFANKCPSQPKSRRNVHQVDTDSDSCDNEEFVLAVDSVNRKPSHDHNKFPRKIFARMLLQGTTLVFQLDCGATVNILPESDYVRIYGDPELKHLDRSSTTLVMFNGTQTVPVGKRRVTVKNPKNNKKYNVEMLTVKGNCRPLLGARAVQQMQLIKVKSENIMLLGQQCSQVINSFDEVLSTYSDVFEGEGKLEGLLHLEVDTSMPSVQLPCRKVPVALQDQVKSELDRLTEKGIITPVSVPTDWISALVVVKKSDGRLRLCIDPKPLNKALKRNHYPTPTIEDLLPGLNNAKVFSHADTKNGFWHVELDKASSMLTTFETPWGRYRWQRMPFGISPAPEEFQRRLHLALEGLDGVRAVHDDVLIFGVGETVNEADLDHDRKLISFFERCREKHIKLNPAKFQFKCSEVPYLGHTLTSSGLKVDQNKVEAIQKMPEPTDKQGVRRILGMVNFLQKFAPRLSEVTAPLRNLLKDDTHFVWDAAVHGKCLNEVKEILSSPPLLKYFDPKSPTVLQCDASQSGLGACLMQNDQPVAYASRSLTATEQNYAQIERELLSIVFGLEKFEQYVYGSLVTVETDHKPLESIVVKSLHSAPKRLQRMLLRLQKFEYEVVYKKGKDMYLADTLSRAYLPCSEAVKDSSGYVWMCDVRSCAEAEIETINMVEYLAISDKRLDEIQRATESDETMLSLRKVIHQGWPYKQGELQVSVQPFFPFRDELSLQNGIIFKGERVVIPLSLRQQILQRLHSSHIGIQGCLRRARELVYWPNMTKEITELVRLCDTCNSVQQSQPKETLVSHKIPSRPWEKVGCDLFEFHQKDYLITVDYYSDFFEIDRLHSKTGKTVVKVLKAHFARHGIPVEFMSDNGPPFNAADFRAFMDAYEITHLTSSPRYPQSNGKVESAVKSVKRLMEKSKTARNDPFLALLEFRNVPTENVGYSPVQRLFGRRTRTLLPTSSTLLQPKTVDRVPDKLAIRKVKQSKYYNRSAKDLPPLKKGDVVRMRPVKRGQHWQKAVVDSQAGVRSYNVRTEDGGEYRRNRRDVRYSSEQFSADNGIFVPEHAVEATGSSCVNEPLQYSEKSAETVVEPVVRTSSGRQIRPPIRFRDYVS